MKWIAQHTTSSLTKTAINLPPLGTTVAKSPNFTFSTPPPFPPAAAADFNSTTNPSNVSGPILPPALNFCRLSRSQSTWCLILASSSEKSYGSISASRLACALLSGLCSLEDEEGLVGALFLLPLAAPFFGREEVVAKRRAVDVLEEDGECDEVRIDGLRREDLWVVAWVRGLLEQRVVMLGSMQNLAVIRIRTSRRGGGMVTLSYW
jgi:hypothetical protein